MMTNYSTTCITKIFMFIRHRAVDFVLFVHIQIDCIDSVSIEILYEINHPPPPHFLLSFCGSRRSNVGITVACISWVCTQGRGSMPVPTHAPLHCPFCVVLFGVGETCSHPSPPPPPDVSPLHNHKYKWIVKEQQLDLSKSDGDGDCQNP